jgi:hypothetical protein
LRWPWGVFSEGAIFALVFLSAPHGPHKCTSVENKEDGSGKDDAMGLFRPWLESEVALSLI